MSEKTTLGENGIYDARSLGVPKMLLLGLQHISCKFQKRILPVCISAIYIDQIRQYLKGIKTDPQRKSCRTSPALKPD